MIDQDQSLPFNGKCWVGYGMFILYFGVWYGLSMLFGFSMRETTFWAIAVAMSSAHVYYVIQAYDSTGGRNYMDLVLNFVQASLTTLLIMAHLSEAISLEASLLLVGIVAFAHPLLTDFHHIRRYFRTNAARFCPPACILIDFTAAALALIAFVL